MANSSPVPFWDENLRELSLQPQGTVDLTQCHVVKVPRFKSNVPLYTPNGSLAYPAITPIIPQDVADTEGRTFVATLHFDRLGAKANILRAVSKKHRNLYVGSIPSMQERK